MVNNLVILTAKEDETGCDGKDVLSRSITKLVEQGKLKLISSFAHFRLGKCFL
jgi:hypothetical protein